MPRSNSHDLYTNRILTHDPRLHLQNLKELGSGSFFVQDFVKSDHLPYPPLTGFDPEAPRFVAPQRPAQRDEAASRADAEPEPDLGSDSDASEQASTSASTSATAHARRVNSGADAILFPEGAFPWRRQAREDERNAERFAAVGIGAEHRKGLEDVVSRAIRTLPSSPVVDTEHGQIRLLDVPLTRKDGSTATLRVKFRINKEGVPRPQLVFLTKSNLVQESYGPTWSPRPWYFGDVELRADSTSAPGSTTVRGAAAPQSRATTSSGRVTRPEPHPFPEQTVGWKEFSQISTGVRSLGTLLPDNMHITWREDGRNHEVTKSPRTGDIVITVDRSRVTIPRSQGSVTLDGRNVTERTRTQVTEMMRTASHRLSQEVRGVPIDPVEPDEAMPDARYAFIGANAWRHMFDPEDEKGAEHHEAFAALGLNAKNWPAFQAMLREIVWKVKPTLEARSNDASFFHIDFPILDSHGEARIIRTKWTALDDKDGKRVPPYFRVAFVRTYSDPRMQQFASSQATAASATTAQNGQGGNGRSLQELAAATRELHTFVKSGPNLHWYVGDKAHRLVKEPDDSIAISAGGRQVRVGPLEESPVHYNNMPVTEETFEEASELLRAGVSRLVPIATNGAKPRRVRDGAAPLPNASKAVIDKKAWHLMLDEVDPVGKQNAALFAKLGFLDDKHAALAEFLLDGARRYPAEIVQDDSTGTTYRIEIPIRARDGNVYTIRTKWTCEDDQANPVFKAGYVREESFRAGS